MSVINPTALDRSIRAGYLRYFETAFWLRDPKLRAERRQLVERDGVVFTDPLLEPVLPYETGATIGDTCDKIGLEAEEADSLARMLLSWPPKVNDRHFALRPHQAESLRISLAPAGSSVRNVVVTAGTGSGKTECFLLPIFARLMREARSWHGGVRPYHWWRPEEARRPWRPTRVNEGRPAAIRAIVLYPTNALVEDQISRLRRALYIAKAARLGPFYFGRYTGATLGPQDVPATIDGLRVEQVAKQLQKMEAEAQAIASKDLDLRVQFPDPRESEQLTRWDMITKPPDILVTNYSMLNVMLMRAREEHLFSETAKWLKDDDEHCLTLVVDELHTYRGTQGSEVALVVRNLLRRLQLDPESDQLRCIGTSASLDSGGGLSYLEQFFGVNRETFEIVPGATRPTPPPQKLSRSRMEAVAQAMAGTNSEQVAQETLSQFDLGGALAAACFDGSTVRPTRLSVIDERLFDVPPHPESKALEAALDVLGHAKTDMSTVSFRAHLFARLIRGLWACSNPTCSEVEGRWRSDERQLGKLYSIPAHTCRCGGRILELLYLFPVWRGIAWWLRRWRRSAQR